MTGIKAAGASQQAAARLPRVKAQDLAWLAEIADGRRDQNMVLYRRNGRLTVGPETEATRATAVLRIRTDSRKRRLERIQDLAIHQDWDAIFLSESAVEKFLFPYYEAQRLLPPDRMEALRLQYYESDVLGIVHIWPSRPKFLVLQPDGTLGTRDFDVESRVEYEVLAPEEAV